MRSIQLTMGLFNIAFVCREGQFLMIRFDSKLYFRFGRFEPDTPQDWFEASGRLTPERLLDAADVA